MSDDLKDILQVGLSVQAFSVIVSFAIKKDKGEFLKQLAGAVKAFEESLTAEEKDELKKDVDAMLEQKANEVMKNMEETLTEDQMNEVVGAIGNLTK